MVRARQRPPVSPSPLPSMKKKPSDILPGGDRGVGGPQAGSAVGCPIGKTSRFRQGFIVKESLTLWPLKQNQAKQNACCLVLSLREKGDRRKGLETGCCSLPPPPPPFPAASLRLQAAWAGGRALQGESRVSAF